MIKLKKATIKKYKCIESEQSFSIEPDVTVLVGMNESGKTSLLEALAKVNYFEDDQDFKFSLTHDYPRKEKKAVDRSGENPIAVTLEYEISEELQKIITEDILVSFKQRELIYTKKYNNGSQYNAISISVEDFLSKKLASINIKGDNYIAAFVDNKSGVEFDNTIATLKGNGETSECLNSLDGLKKYFMNEWNWDNPIQEYVTRTYLKPNIPKFMYYDDYYMLPSRISIDRINKGEVTESSGKTAKALLELADIDTSKIIDAASYEDFKAELEATQAIISDELFKYWTTNENLRIIFDIDKVEKIDSNLNRQIVDHILDIRVQNLRTMVSLPLANRSKGFNWFFSFLVWFKKIQEDHKNTYILLLDEPGLNLHAMAQRDLLCFIEDLASKYQIIYTTHSPFMIESSKLQRVRTVLEKKGGTHVSDCLQEKDPNTLFPLQAALGYTIAQNLFVSENNLLVEGITDLVYLNLLSDTLKSMGRNGLNDGITIVPVGGADKVATFISLMRGNELSIVCLLDSFTDKAAKARLDSMIAQNIIKDKKVMFYHEILNVTFADVEDLFADEDYLQIFNLAFDKDLSVNDIDSSSPIMGQLKERNGGKNFNHYTPANCLVKNIATIKFSSVTLDNFESLFEKVNKKFDVIATYTHH